MKTILVLVLALSIFFAASVSYAQDEDSVEQIFAQAKAYFNARKHQEAAKLYSDFAKQNPTHPKADEAIFKMSQSYNNDKT